MATGIQNYKSSDFLTATHLQIMDDGTEVHFWNDGSISVSQVDEMQQEHTVLLRETIACSGFVTNMILNSGGRVVELV